MPQRGTAPAGFVTAFCLGALAMAAAALGDSTLRHRYDRAAAAELPDLPEMRSRSLTSWRTIAFGALREFNDDRIAAVSAGVTFYVLLALFPAISAFVSLDGLVSNVSDARRQVEGLASILPGGALTVIGDELMRLTRTDHGALGLAFAVSLAFSIWSANAGMSALIDGLNVAYETIERRGFMKSTIFSLGLTLAGILTTILGVSLAAAVPRQVTLDWVGAWEWIRWPALFIVSAAVLAVLYRLGPCRPQARLRWISPGSVVAAMAWLAMSGLFSWYVANFGNYDKTYGSLGAIVGFLTWVWLSTMVLLLGAEINRELEKQGFNRAT